MPQNIAVRSAALLKTLTLILIASCESTDRRLADYAQRATEQQTRQNERIAEQAEAVVKQTHEVTAAAHDLVEQDAAARRDLLQAQDKLQLQHQAERLSIEGQRQQLDAERKASVQAAARDPVIAQALITGGLFFAALLPLLVTVYALRRLPEQSSLDNRLGDTLLDSLLGSEHFIEMQNEPRPSLSDFAALSRIGPIPAGGERPHA